MMFGNSSAMQSVDHSSANTSFQSCTKWLVIVALLVGLGLRLVGLSYPPYDAHSFRQTQTLSTIENYHDQGIDLLRPKAIYMGYPGTFVLEFPLFQAVAALFYGAFGQHIEIVRILNILMGAGATWLVYRITSRFLDRTTATVAAVIFWMAPLNVVYQRSMLIDPTAVFFGLLCFHRLDLLLNPGETPKTSNASETAINFILFSVAAVITALIKALYLWPAVLFLAQQLILKRLRFDRRMLQVIAIFAFAGGCFLIWNFHATQVNNLSPFTRGANPTAHLGFSALLSPEFYKELLLHRTKRWLGAFGILFYAIGILAAWAQRRNRSQWSVLMLVFLIPPTYLVCFANINRPHDYYQLIITPFLAMMSAYGATQLATYLFRRFPRPALIQRIFVTAGASIFVLASALTYLVWMRAPNLSQPILQFEKLCAGKFEPKRQAMIFVSTEVSGLGPDFYIPEFIYAANLWGYGRTVENAAGARGYFKELAPAFPKLEYVVFYGMWPPDWIPETAYREELHDEAHQLYVFRRNAAFGVQTFPKNNGAQDLVMLMR